MANPEIPDPRLIDHLLEQAAVEMPDPEPPRFKIERLSDLEAEPEPEFAIHGILKRGDIAFLYGPAKSNKTFAAVDVTAVLAKGVVLDGPENLFAGQFPVKETWRTVYITNEGRRFLRYRLRAAIEHHQLNAEQADRIMVIRDVPNLFDGSGIDELIELLKGEGVDMIVFDTWARVTVGGDENTTKDMGKVFDNIVRIQSALGDPCVMVVHHANKDGGMRGSTLLPGAGDVFLKFSLDRSSGRASMRSDGVKDGAEFDEIMFHTVEVLNSPRYRAVEWLEPSKGGDQRRDTDQINREKITTYLREYCRGVGDADTIPGIADAIGLSAPTVRKHLASAELDNRNAAKPINGIRLTTKPKGTKKQVAHYYWDSSFEDAS